uniref:Transposase n=1 Tax=Globodera pallida TaxID=36090 RepID=A0A183BVF5_GLOPA
MQKYVKRVASNVYYQPLGKNKDTVDAVHGYELGVNNFRPYCDYFVVNRAVGRVKRELAELLRRDGYAHVAEAVGAQHRTETNSRKAVDE